MGSKSTANNRPAARFFQRFVLCLGLLIPLLFLGFTIWDGQWTPNQRTIEFGPATTVLTESDPRLEDGRPDYLAAINRERSRGVTASGNAAIEYHRLLGDGLLDSRIAEALYRAWGIEPFPADRPLLPLAAFEQTPASPSEMLPWRDEQWPTLAAYFLEHAVPLEAASRATGLPGYFVPLISTDARQRLYAAALIQVDTLRRLARLWCVQAGQSLGNGDATQALERIATVRRMTRQTARSSVLIEQFANYRLEDMARVMAEQSAILSTAEDLPALRQSLEDWRRPITERPSLAVICDQGERFLLLDVLLSTRLHGPDEALVRSEMRSINYYSSVDWDQVLRQANSWTDRLVEVLSIDDRRLQYAAAQALRTDSDEEAKSLESSGQLFALLSRRNRTRRMATLLVRKLLPAAIDLVQAQTTQEAKNRLTIVSLALAIHFHRQGRYPDSLSELVELVGPESIIDPWSDSPLRYQVLDHGTRYRLYSIDRDQVDHRGAGIHQPDGHDLNACYESILGIVLPEEAKPLDDR